MRSEFNAYTALCTQAQTRAQWAAVLAPSPAKRSPIQKPAPRGFFARLFAR